MSTLGQLLDEVEAHLRLGDADDLHLVRTRLPRVMAEAELALPSSVDLDVLRVHLFGCFRVEMDGKDRTPPGMPGQLLRLVALRAAPVHVDEAAECLWPEAAPGQGRTRLRNVLTRLREAAGDAVVRHGDCLQLRTGAEVDLHRFALLADGALEGLRSASTAVRAAARSRAERALSIARGELLPGDAYAAWAAAARTRHERRVVAVLDAVAHALAEEGDRRRAAARLLDAIDLDPYDEVRYVQAARLLADDGRRGAAITTLDLARTMLDDLGVPPSRELRALLAELRSR